MNDKDSDSFSQFDAFTRQGIGSGVLLTAVSSPIDDEFDMNYGDQPTKLSVRTMMQSAVGSEINLTRKREQLNNSGGELGNSIKFFCAPAGIMKRV